MNIQQEREFIQELLESGKLDSLSVQVISLLKFAKYYGWNPVSGDPRKGFYCTPVKTTNMSKSKTTFKSFYEMQEIHNDYSYGKTVERISLQYNKKLGKLTTQKHWLKFVKES